MLFALQLGRRRAALPLALGVAGIAPVSHEPSWQSTTKLVWVLIGPVTLVFSIFASIAVELAWIVNSMFTFYVHGTLARFSPVMDGMVLAGVVLVAMGSANRRVALASIRRAAEKYFVIATALPVVSIGAVVVGAYLKDRIAWLAQQFQSYPGPQFAHYLTGVDPFYLLAFFPALAEEIIFRGVLQQRFIARFGAYRGIWLVGVVWAAFHFLSDRFSLAYSVLGVLEMLFFRVSICVAMGLVLSWLTLRSGSVLPAAVAHTISNVLIYAKYTNVTLAEPVRLLAWIALALILFRYSPIEDNPTVKPVTFGEVELTT